MRATSQARVVCLCVRAYSCSAVCFVRREELWNGIAQVNAFFVDKERSLLAELQNSADDDASRAELYGQVSDLRSHVILNYLAVLKIAKKHDKHSVNPLRSKVRASSGYIGRRRGHWHHTSSLPCQRTKT